MMAILAGIALLCIPLLPVGGEVSLDLSDDEIRLDVLADRRHGYATYSDANRGTPAGRESIRIRAASFAAQSEEAGVTVLSEFEGEEGVLLWSSIRGWVEWTVDIPSDGLYELCPMYYPLEGKQRAIEVALAIDGEVPFSEAASLTLQRAWTDEAPIRLDPFGNEYNSRPVEAAGWRTAAFLSTDGHFNGAYRFLLRQGRHTLRIHSIQEPFVLAELVLEPAREAPTYSEYRQALIPLADHSDADVIRIEAESAGLRSDQTIRPVPDRSDPLTFPYSPTKVRLNIIGQNQWRTSGQWLEWHIDVPVDGDYSLVFRYQQFSLKGMKTSRRLRIDGQVPFREAEKIEFPYSVAYGPLLFGSPDGSPYQIRLTKGIHVLRMEVVMGDLAPIVRETEEDVFLLNEVYRRILMVTGSQPDPYRDYFLEKEIPGLLDTLSSTSSRLRSRMDDIERISGRKGGQSATAQTLALQLEDLVRKPETLPHRLDAFKSNIGSLSAWATELKNQSLDLDAFLLVPEGQPVPRLAASFFERTIHEIRSFFSSFFEDYNMMSAASEKGRSITLWLMSGRDQAHVIRRMIDDRFTPSTGISVNLKLVNASVIQAKLSGYSPDVSVLLSRGQPVNLAARGAVYNLARFTDFQAISRSFRATALDPYRYQDGYYALPDTQSFFMLFYRRDILRELGLEVPDTWEEFHAALRTIQKRNMDVGIPYQSIDAWEAVETGMGSRNLFSALLFQHGGSMYNPSGTRTGLDSPAAQAAFREWVEIYTRYGLPISYDFYNRFRSGEMPMAIANYAEYSRIEVAAPEIRNLWSIAPLPGTLRQDGTIDRTQGGAGSGAVIFSGSKDPEASWIFLKWWTGEDAQRMFAQNIEIQLGVATRVPVANPGAFRMLPWSPWEAEALETQWQQVREIPEVPGGYAVVRNLDNAFRESVYEGRNPIESLLAWNRETNVELARKRRELGLE